ncbi:MAG: Na+/H+ antiporter subunit E [Candidatus Anammoxibacter sp.]
MKRAVLRYFVKAYRIFHFFFFFIMEVIIANLKIAYEIVTPTHNMRPGVIAIPLDAQSDFEVITIANIITMTPGTLSLDVTMDRRVLYIHAMYIHDIEALRNEIRLTIMKKIKEILR